MMSAVCLNLCQCCFYLFLGFCWIAPKGRPVAECQQLRVRIDTRFRGDSAVRLTGLVPPILRKPFRAQLQPILHLSRGSETEGVFTCLVKENVSKSSALENLSEPQCSWLVGRIYAVSRRNRNRVT